MHRNKGLNTNHADLQVFVEAAEILFKDLTGYLNGLRRQHGHGPAPGHQPPALCPGTSALMQAC